MPGATHKLENSAMFSTEIEIMALWDQGCSVEDIAAALGKKATYIKIVVRRFNVNGSNFAFNDMVARGSDALLAAIRRHHPERFAGGAS